MGAEIFCWWGCSGKIIRSSRKEQTHKANISVNQKNAQNCVEHWLFIILQWASRYSSWRYKSWTLCKIDKISKIHGNFLDEDVEKFDDQGSPKIRDLVDPKEDKKMWNCSSCPFRHNSTLQFADREANLIGNWNSSSWSCKFCIVKCFVNIYVTESSKRFLFSFRDEILIEWAYKLDEWSKRSKK